MSKEATLQIPVGADPVQVLLKAHLDQLALCDRLEEIADSLPDQVNRQKCIYAALALGPMIRGLHKFEEEVVFPLIAAEHVGDELTTRTLNRLKFEHCEDECFAEELIEALHDLGAGKRDMNMEATGYMLRGFFEALRRHIAFENELLLRWRH